MQLLDENKFEEYALLENQPLDITRESKKFEEIVATQLFYPKSTLATTHFKTPAKDSR